MQPQHSPQICSIFFSRSVPCRALWRHVSENLLRLWVRDGNDVFVVWSYDFLWVCLLSEFSGARALAVGVRGEGEGGDGGWGAECWVGNRKGWGEPGFGAGHCRVITPQEVVVDLVVSLLSGDNSFIMWTAGSVTDYQLEVADMRLQILYHSWQNCLLLIYFRISEESAWWTECLLCELQLFCKFPSDQQSSAQIYCVTTVLL